MFYIMCPTCRSPMGNKYNICDKELEELIKKKNVDINYVSKYIITDNELNEERGKILKKYFHRPCCVAYAMTRINVVEFIN